MKMKRMLSFTLAGVLAATSFAYAASPVTKTYTFTTTDKSYESYTLEDLDSGELIDAPKKITIDGKKYVATKVDFKEVKTKERKKRTKTYTGLAEKKVPKTLTLKDGEKLKLEDVDWTENTRTAARGTLNFNGVNGRPSAPQTKDITATLPDGSSITVTGNLQSVKKTGSSFSKPFTVKARFVGDEDVSGYQFGSVMIPNNPNTPVFEGYESVILNHLGYDPQEYSLTDGRWTSGYITENGQTVRYAEFSGMQLASNWTAYYTETISADSPQLTTYDAKAKYTNGNAEYTVDAIVTYEKVGLTLLQKIIIASAAIIIIAGLISAILMIIRKKRDKEEPKETMTN